MVATEHLVSRMNQRGIPGKLLNLVIEFGEQKQDKIILDRKLTLKIIQEIDQMRKDLIKIVDKGGVVLVAVDNVMITTYNRDSYRRMSL